MIDFLAQKMAKLILSLRYRISIKGIEAVAAKGKKGILEPKKEYYRLFPPEDIDLIIIPGVVFDLSGNRIGRGFGYYDNFLGKVCSSAEIIALAFEMQIVKKIPNDKNDIPVHKIITEKRIINSIEYPVSGI